MLTTSIRNALIVSVVIAVCEGMLTCLDILNTIWKRNIHMIIFTLAYPIGTISYKVNFSVLSLSYRHQSFQKHLEEPKLLVQNRQITRRIYICN